MPLLGQSLRIALLDAAAPHLDTVQSRLAGLRLTPNILRSLLRRYGAFVYALDLRGSAVPDRSDPFARVFHLAEPLDPVDGIQLSELAAALAGAALPRLRYMQLAPPQPPEPESLAYLLPWPSVRRTRVLMRAAWPRPPAPASRHACSSRSRCVEGGPCVLALAQVRDVLDACPSASLLQAALHVRRPARAEKATLAA